MCSATGVTETVMVKASRILAGSLGLAALATLAQPVWAADAQPHAGLAPTPWAMLGEYCIDCHNATDWAGGLAFDTMTESEIPQNAEIMEKAVRKLRGQLMPPGGNRRPDAKTVSSFISWMEGNLDAANRAKPDPGRVGLHRLNRKEYANAIKDLLNVQVDVEALLPRDDASEGFDNVANALQVTPVFIDQYVSAARIVALQALGNKDALPGGTTYRGRSPGTQFFHEAGLPLGTRGGVVVDHNFPADGDYVINIANMAQALWVYNMEFQNTLIVTVDGAQIYETKIGGEDDMKAIDQKQDPAVDAINQRLKNIRFHARAGVHKVAVAFRHRSFAESEDRLQMYVPGGGQDRVLRVSSFEIRGPFDVTGVSRTPSRDQVFTCYPKNAAEEQPCAEEIVGRIARRAFRRPVTTEDLHGLMSFYAEGRKASDFDAGVRRAITAILAHPDFLYRAELPDETLQAGGVYRISDLDLASRLSFFLWSTLPDDELLEVAAAGKLHDEKILAQQATRMLADPRAITLASNFGYQWLNLAKLSEINPDGAVFPGSSGAGDMREDFRTELRLFMDDIFRGNHNVLELLTSDRTFVNERLALHYGITDVRGDQFREVKLTDSARYGLLGKGGVLMVSSYPNRTAPVLRGAYILERITGTPPAAPPPNVGNLVENEAGKKTLTVRERMAQHSTRKQCFACHGIMDPLGFALENFDAVGKYRSIDRFARTPIDANGKLPDGTELNGPDGLRKALLERKDQFVQTLTEKLMTYALGRAVEYYDMPTVREIVRRAARDDYHFNTIVMNIVTSDAFQKRRLPAENDTPLIKQAAVQR